MASLAVPVTRLHADELDVDDGLVRDLLADQLPRWADLPPCCRRASLIGRRGRSTAPSVVRERRNVA